MPWRAWSSACCRRSRLYWIAAEASSRRLQRVVGRHVAPAQQQRQREPRRRGADGRGEEVLGVAQEMDVGLGAPVERMPRLAREALEGAAGALLAEIARDRRPQLVDRDAGAEQPEARRDRGVVGADEGRWPAGARARSPAAASEKPT